MSDNERPVNAEKISRAEFNEWARAKRFTVGPFVSSFGDGHGEPYIPYRNRPVWGRLQDGRAVWADHE